MHQVSVVESVMSTLLFPRQLVQKNDSPQQPGLAKGEGKRRKTKDKARTEEPQGKRQKTKQKGEGKGKSSKNADQSRNPAGWNDNWAKEIEIDGVRTQFCRRYNVGAACNTGCRFLHTCAFWTRGGPCNGNHPACEHGRHSRNQAW